MKTLATMCLLLFATACARRVAVAPVKPIGSGWVDLVPLDELRIENAYYKTGMPKRGIDGYLGTSTAHFQVKPKRGLALLTFQSALKEQPKDQLPVQDLIPAAQRNDRVYRYFYAVVFSHRGNLHGSVLLGATSMQEMEQMGARLLTDPESVCGAASKHCTVFPEMCTVSIDIEIVVNGAPRAVLSGTLLANVAAGAKHVEILRAEAGRRPAAMQIDAADPNALRVPLMPGDQVRWQ